MKIEYLMIKYFNNKKETFIEKRKLNSIKISSDKRKIILFLNNPNLFFKNIDLWGIKNQIEIIINETKK